MKPLILITAGEVHNKTEPWSPTVHGQSYTYIEAIIRAGGVPFIAPIVDSPEAIRQLYDMADGILFAGGNDPDPALYGEEPYPQTVDVSKKRDALELELLRWALADQKPLLAICRGMQLLNVHLGGTLHQDIPTDLPSASDHDSSTKRKSLVDVAHILKVIEQSQLAKALGSTKVGANTHHHQAIKKLGSGLDATAWSEDSVIEGVEMVTVPFAIGVQCHPESLEAHAEPLWQNLFAAFTAQATSSRKTRKKN